MTTVLVVDDQVLIRAGLAALIQAAPGLETVGQASDGLEAIEMARATSPDVILMDVRMPGMSGATATERILAEAGRDAPKILVLTTFDPRRVCARGVASAPAASCSRTRLPSGSSPPSTR
jgi:DNA-binding NarL/FixJ family response regulator